MASRVKGITVEIGGDTTGLDKALSKINSSIYKTQYALKDVNKLLKLDPTNTTLLAQKHDLLQKEIANTENKLEELKKADKQAKIQLESGDLGKDKYNDLQREIIATEQHLKELKNTTGSGSVAMAKIAATTGEFGSKATAAGKAIMPISTGMLAIGTIASKTAIDFETAFTGVKKTVDATEEEFASLKEGIIEMSKETNSSAVEIAAVAEAAGQLGIEKENLLEFTKTMIMLGDTTNLEATEAASALSKFANVTNMSADNYERLGSVIVDLGNNFATTERDIVSMGTRLAATGELAGFSEQQIMAIATALSSLGIEAEAGGSSFSKLTKLMQVSVETGNKKLDKFAKVAGMTRDEFVQAFEKDSLAAIGAFISGLNDTERNGKSAIAILDELGMTEVRLSNTILSLSNNEEVLNRAIRTANNAWDSNTALTKEAELRYQTLAAKINQLKARFADIGVIIGEILMPYIEKFVTKISQLVDWFSNLSPEIQNIIVQIGAFIAVLGPTLLIIGKVLTVVSTIFGTLSKVGGIVTLLTNPVGQIIAAILLVIAAITTVVATIKALWKNCEWFRNGVLGLTNFLKLMLTGFLSWLQESINGFITFFQSMLLLAQTIVKVACEKIKSVISSVAKFFMETIPSWFSAGTNKIKIIITELQQKISSAFTSIKNWISEKVTSAKNAAVNGFWSLVNGVGSAVKSLSDKINSVFQNIKNIIKNWASQAWTWGWDFINGLKSGIESRMNAIVAKARELGERIRAYLHFTRPDKGPLRDYETWMPDFMEGMAQGIDSNMYRVTDAVQRVANAMQIKMPNMDSILSLNGSGVNVNNAVTVQIGNKQFDSYIVNAAQKGISNNQRASMRAKGI